MEFVQSGKPRVAFVMDNQEDEKFWASVRKWLIAARNSTFECSEFMLKLFCHEKIDLDNFGKLANFAFSILKEIHWTSKTSHLTKEQVSERFPLILCQLRNLKNELESLDAEPLDVQGSSIEDHKPAAEASTCKAPDSGSCSKADRRNRRIAMLLSHVLVRLNRRNMDKEDRMTQNDFLDNSDLIAEARLRLERIQAELGEELDDWIENQMKILSEEMNLIQEKLESVADCDV